MNFLFLFLLLLRFYNFCESRTADNLKVQIDDGQIIGRYMNSISGRGIRSFIGIPYAAPPVGELRFKAPIKPDPWHNNVLMAQNEPPMCTQTNIFDRGEKRDSGQEDCLYLNVYAPNVNITNEGFKKLPVMVWFHGGGWLEGHSGYSLYGPGYLLDHDVILVTGNYRLGPLGFLSTEDEHCPGNFGLKDQHMMLEWVQENIEKFGGDRDSVTIFGESAGGATVNYLMNSPKSRKLFHRAISQSGNLMNIWADPHRKGLAKERATKLAELMNCPQSSSTQEIIECLREVTASKITDAVRDFMVWDYDPIMAFGAVLENFGPEETRFVENLNYDELAMDIPWMVGVNSEEGIFKSLGVLGNQNLSESLVQNWQTIFPISFYYDHLPEQEKSEISAAIYDYYFKTNYIGENLTAMWSDGWVVNGFIDNLQQRLSSNKCNNTFVYLFSHKGSISFSELLRGDPEEFYGTCHQDDLLYLFPMRQNIPYYFNSIPTDEDIKLRKIMTKMWVNYATTGNPTPKCKYDTEQPLWSPATKFPLDYMRIGNENGNSDKLLEMKKDLFTENAQFWINMRRKYGLRVWNSDE